MVIQRAVAQGQRERAPTPFEDIAADARQEVLDLPGGQDHHRDRLDDLALAWIGRRAKTPRPLPRTRLTSIASDCVIAISSPPSRSPETSESVKKSAITKVELTRYENIATM